MILAKTATCSTTCVRTKAGLIQLADDWNDLFERAQCGHVFLSHEWMTAWWEEWGNGHELFIIQIRNPDGQLAAIAPFYIRRPAASRFGPRILAFLASTGGVASDHLDVLIDAGNEAPFIQEIVRLVLEHRRCWDYIELADCDADSGTLAAFRREFEAANLLEHCDVRPERPYAPLPSSFHEFLGMLGPSVRYNFRRRLRNLQRSGEVEVCCVTENSEIQAQFYDFMRLHHMRFDQIGKASSFRDSQLLNFHLRLLKRMDSKCWPRLYLLRVCGQTVAALYGFSVRGRFSFYQSGMDPAWAKESVGMVMLGCSIERAIESGSVEFDFLRGSQSYKLLWAKHSRAALTVRFFDRRPKSLFPFLFLRFARRASLLKRALRNRPASKVPS